MFDDIEDWCKIWKKTYLCFQNDMRNFILKSKMVEL